MQAVIFFIFFFEPKRELSRLHSERKIRKLIEEKTMEPLREKMMNQKSMADVQKNMHQFNKGTRKDKDGKGTGNHKNDIVFKEVENSFGNMDRYLKVLSRYVYTQMEKDKVMRVYDVYHESEKQNGYNRKQCRQYGNTVYEYHERTKKKNCKYPIYEIMQKDIHSLTTLDVDTCEYREASIEEIMAFCRSLKNTFETYCLNRFMGKDRVVVVDGNTRVNMPEDYSCFNTDYTFYRSVVNRINEIEQSVL